MSQLDEMVLPAVWSLIRSELVAGPGPTRDELIQRLTPVGLIDRAGNAPAASRHVGPTLRALQQLNLVVSDDDELLSLEDPGLSEPVFRAAVADRMLTVPSGVDPFEIREGGQQPEYHAELAVAWLHLQGFEEELAGWREAVSPLLDAQFGTSRALLRDTAPYNTLERLVRWLGIGDWGRPERGGRQAALLPDPTRLLRTVLEDLIPEGSVPALEFLNRTGQRFPWLPHGEIGRAVAQQIQGSHRLDRSPDEQMLPQGLTLALTRLQFEKRIILEEGDDPKRRVRLQYPGSAEDLGIARVVIA
jgi:hypothetical protein